jgi:ATP-dependent Lon protease
MKESVNTALSYIRSHAKELHLDPTIFEKSEIHVHVPAGAVPKDGPSAGITMLTALTSLLTSRLIKPRLAMTGEMTLMGHVLPVGGIKEKVLAAYAAGVKEIILPEENRKDYQEDITTEIRRKLKVHYVKQANQVLQIAFQGQLNA